MAKLNLDLKALQGDLNDRETLKRMKQALYQFSEELRYWQNHVEPDNLTSDFRTRLQQTADDAQYARQKTVDIARDLSEPAVALENACVSVGAEGVTVKDGQGVTAVRLTGDGAEVSVLTVGGTPLATLIRDGVRGHVCVSDAMPGPGCVWVLPGQEAEDHPGAYLCRVLYVPEAAQG